MAIEKDRRALWRRGSARTDRVGVVGSQAAQDGGWRAHKPQFPCEVGQNAGAEGGRRGVAARRRGPFGMPPMRPARSYAGAAVLIFGERGGRIRDVRASIGERSARVRSAPILRPPGRDQAHTDCGRGRELVRAPGNREQDPTDGSTWLARPLPNRLRLPQKPAAVATSATVLSKPSSIRPFRRIGGDSSLKSATTTRDRPCRVS